MRSERQSETMMKVPLTSICSPLRCSRTSPILWQSADPSIPDSSEEWLDKFSTFSIYQVLPKIIELWGLNVQTDVKFKKNFTQLTAR